MILVTGGAGFIGSAYIWHLNRQGITGILVADRLHSSNKWKNLTGLQIADYIDRSGIFAYLEHYGIKPDIILLKPTLTFQKKSGSIAPNKKLN